MERSRRHLDMPISSTGERFELDADSYLPAWKGQVEPGKWLSSRGKYVK